MIASPSSPAVSAIPFLRAPSAAGFVTNAISFSGASSLVSTLTAPIVSLRALITASLLSVVPLT